MGNLFKDMLSSDESLFKNEIALSYEFVPKIIPYRETQQRYVASCIKPLFNEMNGKNLFIYGQPGVGKTVACKHVFKEMEEETDDIIPVYVNCWQRNTSHKVMVEICSILGYKLTHNKKTEELVEVIKGMLNKKAAVFTFDEIDKVEDFDFLYTLLEEIYRKSVFLITNYRSWFDELEERIKSRLMAEPLEFKPYNHEETNGILKQRMGYAFVPGVWDSAAFDTVVEKAAKLQDIRLGLYLMKEAGLVAENSSSRKVLLEHTKKVVEKIDEFSIKNSAELTKDERFVLDIVKENPDKKIGNLFEVYQQRNGTSSYKTFQRKINRLQANKFISVERTEGGKEGNTTIIKLTQTKKLTEF
jgi:cell division control protein 6